MSAVAASGNRDEIEQECIRRIAEAKGIPADTVMPDTTLESLAIDSLDRVSLSFDMEEQYEVEIPESKLHELVTVGDIVAAMLEALAKKNAALSAKLAAS